MWRGRASTVKRWALKLTLATIVGAVVTWSVACGCALWAPLPPGGTKVDGSPWSKLLLEHWPPNDFIDWEYAKSRVATRTQASAMVEDFEFMIVRFEEFGWPCRALIGKTGTGAGQLQPLYPAPRFLAPRSSCEGLPLSILPLGFALNTLMSAGVVLGVFEGFGAARRWRRTSKGRCAWCGYHCGDRAGSTVCPECGGAA